MDYKQAKEYVTQALYSIKEYFREEWQPLQTRADERAYEILGRIYEESAAVDQDDLKRQALIEVVNCVEEVKNSKKWSPGGKPSTELMVTFLLGLRSHRSRKHNWVSALAYAKECGINPTNAEFQAWIKLPEVGGIDGAAELFRGEGGPVTAASLSEVAAELEGQAAGAETIDLKVSDTAPEGLAILIVRRTDEEHATVLRKVVDESKIRRVLTDLGIVRKPRRPSDTQVKNAERHALYMLNRLTKKLASGTRLGKKDPVQFMRAVKRLKDIPALSEKYFDEEPGFQITAPDHAGKGGAIEVKNLDFDVLDPGRFISGARQGELIPYAFDETDRVQTKRALDEYLERQNPTKPEKPGPRSNPPTLEPFIQKDEPKGADSPEPPTE